MSDLEKVKQDWYNLKYIEHQTEEMCLAAVKKIGYAVRYVQPHYFNSAVNSLRLRALFDPELENYIKYLEKEMRT